jgi:rhodanese-related sulfurtransferase
MKRIVCLIFLLGLILSGCTQVSTIETENTYYQISQDEAKSMMDAQSVIILDVREQHEYDEAHISNAVLLPLGSINEESAASIIPNKEFIVLVYCRSGNRSKQASQKLVDLGYTAVYEFGGINTWDYEVE